MRDVSLASATDALIPFMDGSGASAQFDLEHVPAGGQPSRAKG